MAARAADRRRAHSVELAIEARALLLEAQDLDSRCDAEEGRGARLFAPIRQFVASVVGGIPGAHRAWAAVVAFMESTRRLRGLDARRDRKVAEAIAAITQLDGLLDDVPERVSA